MLLPTSGKSRPDNHGCKNWLNDPQLNYKPIPALKDYMKAECVIVKEIFNSIEEADFFEQLEVDDD